MQKYCAGAEKSTHDVVTKLEELEIPQKEINEIMQALYTDKFVDDARYAKSYASEKLNLDLWGRKKIANALEQKNIPEEIIEDALNGLDERDYMEKLHLVLLKKFRDVKSENPKDDGKRVLMFALSRGFEEELVIDWLESHGLC
jgi:regulatory protein